MLKNLPHQRLHRRRQRPQYQKDVILDDPLGRSTPQGTVIGFIKSVDKEDYERAIEYLDTKQPPKRAQQLAEQLQVILNWGLADKFPKLSNKAEGDLEDGLKPNKERIGTVKTSTGAYDITLERVQRGTDPHVWLFSSETLRHLPEVHRDFEYDRIEHYVPKFLKDTKTFQLPVVEMDSHCPPDSVSLVHHVGNHSWSPYYLPPIYQETEENRTSNGSKVPLESCLGPELLHRFSPVLFPAHPPIFHPCLRNACHHWYNMALSVFCRSNIG